MLDFLFYSLLFLFVFIFLGLGLSFLICPVKFEKYSLFFAPVIGISYLSFSGWFSANHDIGGVDNYWPYLLIPPVIFLLLSIALKKQRILEIFWPFRRENLLLPVLCLILYLCISCPFLIKFDYLTTISIGNNDIALYAAAAKFLMYSSLSHIDPSLDLAIQNYAGNFDSLFGSCFIIAYMSSISGTEPYQITSIIINLFFVFNVAFTFIISYELFRYSKPFSLILALLTGLSFHLIYILYHGFFAQVLGTGIFLALYLVIYYPILYDNQTTQSFFHYVPFAIILSLGLMSIYLTLVPLFVIPLLVFLGIRLITEKNIVPLKKEVVFLLSVLFFIVSLFPVSVIQIFGRLLALNSAVVGWDRPILSPDQVLGFVGYSISGVQVLFISSLVLSVVFLVMCFYSMKSLYTDNKKLFLFSVSNLLFVLFFYLYLISKEVISPSFSGDGYKAFKLVTYFLPIILVSCLYYFKNLELKISKKDPGQKTLALGLLGLLLVGNILSAGAMISISENHFLSVSKDIAGITAVDNFENVTSINVQDPEFWTQMWIYYFLFEKHRLYLKNPTYYGASPQTGEWTLKKTNNADILSLLNFTKSGNTLPINNVYYLEKNSSCDIVLYKGWYGLESHQGSSLRWSGKENETPSLDINCSDEDQSVTMKLNYYPINTENNFSILMDGKKITTCSNTYCEIINMNFSRGNHILSFEATIPPQLVGLIGSRYEGYAFSKIEISKNVENVSI
jgi:hypothetical protein